MCVQGGKNPEKSVNVHACLLGTWEYILTFSIHRSRMSTGCQTILAKRFCKINSPGLSFGRLFSIRFVDTIGEISTWFRRWWWWLELGSKNLCFLQMSNHQIHWNWNEFLYVYFSLLICDSFWLSLGISDSRIVSLCLDLCHNRWWNSRTFQGALKKVVWHFKKLI